MNTFIGELYFFTKLSTSFILFIFVIFLSYLLLKSYQDSDFKKLDISSLVEPLRVEIEQNEKNNQNSSNELTSKLNLLATKTNNIEKMINNNNLNSDEVANLNDNLNQLNNRINDLEKIILDQEEKTINKQTSNSKEIDILKKIITIKFKNSLDYKEELILLESLSTKSKKPIFEKLILLKSINFIGIEKLKKDFYEMTNIFMKDLVKSENILIPDFLFDLLNIAPSNNLEISNKNILYIKKAQDYLKDENFYETINYIKKIERHEIYFLDWLEQATIYEDFIKNIQRI